MCVRQAPEGVCVPRCIPISGAFPCWIAPIMVIGSDAVKGFVVIAHCAPTGDAPARCAATLYQEICGNRARVKVGISTLFVSQRKKRNEKESRKRPECIKTRQTPHTHERAFGHFGARALHPRPGRPNYALFACGLRVRVIRFGDCSSY